MKNIKSIKAVFDDGGGEFTRSFVKYDENGNEIVREMYLGEGIIEIKTETSYNSKGQVTGEINYGEDSEITDRMEIERDESENAAKVITYYADGSQSIKTYSRENNGRLVIIKEADDEGGFESCEEIVFDENGNVIEKTVYDEENQVKEKYLFTYNNSGKLTAEQTFEGNHKISESALTYDEAGNLTKKITYNRDGEVIDYVILRYDENGNMIEQQNGDYSLFKITYNESNKVASEQKVNAMGVVEYSKKYIYNEAGELTEENDFGGKTVYYYEYY